ncbi:uncharacterized protein LOC143301947 isoform X2 [Babylonia areolata]|uniref:uncharacterized protein LOC143301947 isoform X2 n=1 Tax=Babylonia areolata TaxID=304850 RepID=UPI003FD0DC7F
MTLSARSEDQQAAAMLTEPLSGRRDLVEGLDAEAILDYLSQHGVLDTPTLQSLRSSPAVTQRNAALLQHVEREGHTAVALFINALRQSGQLHLASSLDNTQRILPVSQGDYFEKQRHKGEVTIIIKVQALLIVVPERDCEGDVIDHTMLAAPNRAGLHQSYDNMLTMEDDPHVITDTADDEEETGKKKSLFCFCFPSRARKQRDRERRYGEQHDSKSPNRHKHGSRESNGAWSSGVTSPQHSSQQGEPADAALSRADSRHNSRSPQRGGGEGKGGRGGGPDKENSDPVIMEYNKRMELVRLKAQTQRGNRTRTTSQSSAVVMCEKWKSGGQYFRRKVALLCQQFEFDLQTYIIKYMEQDRGTLVLSVWTDQVAMFLSNICMTKQQVRQLHKDYSSGTLKERFDALLRSNQCLQKLDIRDMDLHIVIDDDQFQQALRELA